VRQRPQTSQASDDDEIGRLREAWTDLVCARNEEERLLELQLAPLAALLFYVFGEPREEVEAEPIAVAVLAAIRSTVDGWTNETREREAVRVSLADLRMLARRVDVAIEIVRRTRGVAA
jgi:hypothetical protein